MSEAGSIVRLLDGPEGGNDIVLRKSEEPADEILVFRTQIAAAGTLVCCAIGDYPPMEGDLLYKKVSRSDWFDDPRLVNNPSLVPGCAYKFVKEAA